MHWLVPISCIVVSTHCKVDKRKAGAGGRGEPDVGTPKHLAYVFLIVHIFMTTHFVKQVKGLKRDFGTV